MTLLMLAVSAALLMAFSVPVAFALILSSTLVIWLSGFNMMIIPQQVLGGLDSFTLLAIPFFLLAGDLMGAGGMTSRLLAFTNALVGRFRGGLAISNVLSATALAGISGSAVADTSVLGRILIPGMIKSGYSPAFSAAITASANIVGPILPPSIALIIIGVLANLSIMKLFIAAIIPGFLYTIGMLIVARVISVRRNYPSGEPASFREIIDTFLSALWALGMPLLILIGIRTGAFNVTEASAFAVAYALFVGLVIYKELDTAKIIASLIATSRLTAIIMIVVGGAQIVAWLLAYEGWPETFGGMMLGLSGENVILFLILVNILLLLVGLFLESTPAMVMLVPMLFPAAASMGIDPIHFAIVVSMNLMIGMLTPPIAICVNIAAVIARVPVGKALVETLPFFFMALFILLVVTFVPATTLFLPYIVM